MTHPSPPENTLYLAWTDPALSGNAEAEAAQTAVLQCLALVQSYVRAHAATPPEQSWSEALSQLPLISTGAQNTQTDSGLAATGLAELVARNLAGLAGAGPSGTATLAALLPLQAPGSRVRQNIVQTVVSRDSGPATAGIVHLVLAADEADQPSPPPLPPRREWNLTQTTTALTLAYQRLAEPATRASWNELMAGVDTGQVTGLPTYHRLTL